MDKIAICAMFKDEAPYLLEWLAFHKMIGVDLSCCTTTAARTVVPI
jgi:hypothetical protein